MRLSCLVREGRRKAFLPGGRFMKYRCLFFCLAVLVILGVCPWTGEAAGEDDPADTGAARPQSGTLRHFMAFSMNVLDGWNATQPSAQVVAVVSRDRAASFSVVHSRIDGTDPAAFARDMSRRLGGTEPVEKDGWFSFTFASNGVESSSSMHFFGDNFSMITVTDPGGTRRGEIDAMLATIRIRPLP